MAGHFSETELLAFIEGELDVDQSRALNERLHSEPALRATLMQMRDDRATLRTIGEPELPVDFFSELEPQLARPMLMEQPGSYRRRHRPHRIIRIRTVAIAASVLVVVGGAVWISMFGLPGLTTVDDPNGDRLAAADGLDALTDVSLAADPAPKETGGQYALAPPIDEGPWSGTVHHYGPLPASMTASADAHDRAGLHDAASPELMTATFALVIDGDAEAALIAAVEAMGGSMESADDHAVALVRNFSFAEARALERRYPQVFAAAEPEAPVYANISDERTTTPPARQGRYDQHGRFLRSLRKQRPAEEIDMPMSAQLTGPEVLAPSYERQLAFSTAGATHTITVSIDQLGALLARVHHATGAPVSLAAMPDDESMRYGRSKEKIDTNRTGDSAHWVSMQRLAREFIETAQLEMDDAGYILLPVVLD